MNYRMVLNVLGRTLMAEAALLLVPLLVCAIYGEPMTGFLITIGIALVLAVALLLIRPKSKVIFAREGFVIVALTWVVLSAVGALPFVFYGYLNFIDAFFETVSGFTTTGASNLTNVEVLSQGVQFWRCFTHWVGGMGILVFVLAIMPSLSEERPMYLMKAEVPGPTVGKLVPKLKHTAMILYLIYIGLTLLLVVLLLFGKMSLFDALIHSFSVAGTGGFSNRAISAAYYTPFAQYVMGIFMMVFDVNFNIYFLILIGKIKEALFDEELRWFIILIVIAVILIGLWIFPQYSGTEEAFRLSFFQVTSIISSTGLSNTDFTLWPIFAQGILVFLMFVGACAGSTGGGFKVSRLVIAAKGVRNEIRHMLHSRSVNVVKLSKKVVGADVLSSVYLYFIMYVLIIMASTLMLLTNGFDFTTSLTASVSCMGNCGPGLNM
ncbi:MAG: TrkH family potassium uptake protein, partial [Clostridiales bacterium]|nr:TrkH family potassium uptake protein [Clostridiales bacterium]